MDGTRKKKEVKKMNNGQREKLICEVAGGLSNPMYLCNLQAAKELMELFDKISRKPLVTADDYIKFYDDSFYTFQTWKDLVEDEARQVEGLNEFELKEQIGNTIWKLPCGWYVQYV